MDYSSVFVCLMGMGTVFFGLICLIVLTEGMSLLIGRKKAATPASPPAPVQEQPISPEMVAAVSAAIAEDLGTDLRGIRIISMKKL